MSVTISVGASISSEDVLTKIITQGGEGCDSLLDFIAERVIQFQATLLDRNEPERYYVGFDDDGELVEIDKDMALFNLIIRRGDMSDVNIQVLTDSCVGDYWFEAGVCTLSRQAMRSVAEKVLASYRNFRQFSIAC